jgi:hypothetical protein
VFGPSSPSNTLVILRREQCGRALSIAYREERDLGTGETLLEDHPGARFAELAVLHRRAHGKMGGLLVRGDDDSLARREAVGFDDERKPELARRHDRMRRGGIVAGAVPGGRDAVPGHERFREDLAALELGGGTRGTEDAQAARREQIRDAAIERQLGSDDGEVDVLAGGECGERLRVARAHVGQAGHLRNARVARSADDFAHARLGPELPRERVFAAARSDHEHFHDAGPRCKLRGGDSAAPGARPRRWN